MICISCGAYFKKSIFNIGPECQSCADVNPSPYDEDLQADIAMVVNKLNRTPAVFYDDRAEDDSS